MTRPRNRHPALIATAVALPVALLIGILVIAVMSGRIPAHQPVALGSVPAAAAQSEACTTLLPALPGDLDDYAAAELADPAPAGAKAWRRDEGGEPIVLRCGVDRPAEFDKAAALQVVDGVQWFEISGDAQGLPSSTWFAVDRGVYVALTIPRGTGPTPIQTVSESISATLPAKPLDPAPIPSGSPAPPR